MNLDDFANKIIVTIGPSSDHPHIISKLIQSGMNVARLNMAHSSHSHIESVVKTIRTESKRLNCYVGIMTVSYTHLTLPTKA